MKRQIVLIASLLTGLLAAVVTHFFITAKDAEVARQKAAFREKYGSMDVLCFAKDVPAGSVVSRSDFGEINVPALGMRGQALERQNLVDIVGRKTLLGHKRGDVVFWADIEGGNPYSGGLAGEVKRQMRAVSINCNGSSSVSGMVRPNDHVDVIGTFNFPGTDGDAKRGELVTCTILQNVLVIATGKDTAKVQARPNPYGVPQNYTTVTLEVTPREAEMLVFAEQIKGRLTLTLRNRNDTSNEKELPQVDYNKIRSEIEELNAKRQQKMGAR